MQKIYVVKHMFLEIIIYFISLEEKKKTSVVHILESATDTHWLSTWVYTHISSGGEFFKNFDLHIQPQFSIENILLENRLIIKSPSVSPLSPLLSPPIPSFHGTHKVRKFY
jgi:hypothetical protein